MLDSEEGAATGPARWGIARMELVDIGVNLTHASFQADLLEVMQRAREAGVFRQVLTGTSVKGSAQAAKLAERFEGELWSTAGVHPHHASDLDAEGLARLRQMAQAHDCVVAIGECGLDYNRDFSPRPAQREAFAAQLELATELNLPVFLHERDAHEDFVAILREHRSQLGAVVVHCFTGEGPALDAYLALDCHIGITGWICDERRGGHLRTLVPRIPGSRLMLETDAPFLLPRDLPKEQWAGRKRSRRNEPSYLPWVVEAVAAARGESPANLADTSRATANAFFGLASP